MNVSGNTFPQIVLRSTDLDFPDDLPTGQDATPSSNRLLVARRPSCDRAGTR
jgi:hypothetical protein